MSSEASSEQSCVREEAGYDEVFPSAPLMMKRIRRPTHLPQWMRTWMWTSRRETQMMMT